MPLLSHFAEYMYGSDVINAYSTTSSTELPAGVIASLVLFGIAIFVIAYVIMALLLGRIFKKAGVDSWIAWVPFYNTWKTLELGGQQGFWAVLAIIPIVNYVAIVFLYIAMYKIGLKFGKESWFVLLAIFVPIVWYAWLALDSSKWSDKAVEA